MFQVNNKDTRTKSMMSMNTTYFTPFSSVFIADFEQVNVCWMSKLFLLTPAVLLIKM